MSLFSWCHTLGRLSGGNTSLHCLVQRVKKKKKKRWMFFDIDFSYNSEVRGGLNEGLQFKIGPSWVVMTSASILAQSTFCVVTNNQKQTQKHKNNNQESPPNPLIGNTTPCCSTFLWSFPPDTKDSQRPDLNQRQHFACRDRYVCERQTNKTKREVSILRR